MTVIINCKLLINLTGYDKTQLTPTSTNNYGNKNDRKVTT